MAVPEEYRAFLLREMARVNALEEHQQELASRVTQLTAGMTQFDNGATRLRQEVHGNEISIKTEMTDIRRGLEESQDAIINQSGQLQDVYVGGSNMVQELGEMSAEVRANKT